MNGILLCFIGLTMFTTCSLANTVAICIVHGNYGLAWFYAGTTASITDKVGSVMISDGEGNENGYNFWSIFLTTEKARNNMDKKAGSGTPSCTFCSGHDENDELVWQKRRVNLNDGVYTYGVSNQATITSGCPAEMEDWEAWQNYNQQPGQPNCLNETHDGYGNPDITCSCAADPLELECDPGYFANYYDCAVCQRDSTFFGCNTIEDFFGCTECEDGLELAYYRFDGNPNDPDFLPNDGIYYCGIGPNITEPDYSETPCHVDGSIRYDTCEFYDNNGYCENQVHCMNPQPWGCAQCEEGYWMLSHDHPCRECPPHCNVCDDWTGCLPNQCEDGYIWRLDDDCGFGRCFECDINYDRCDDGIVQCSSLHCNGANENDDCVDPQEWGCAKCKDGYFMKSHEYPCSPCPQGCNEGGCIDFQGCVENECEDGYSWYSDNICGIGRCYEGC